MILIPPLWAPYLLAHPTAVAWARLRSWPVESQQRARRNAMIAATDCAQRRAEREDVADFLRARRPGIEHVATQNVLQAASPGTPAVPATRPARRALG